MRFPAARFALPSAAAIVVLLAFVAVGPAPAVAQAGDDGAIPAEANTTTTFGFDLQENGDARVSITFRLALPSEASPDGFDRMADEHTSGSDSPMAADPFERAAAQASEATGRSMEIRSVTRTASRTNRTGHLTLQFTWTNFTRVADGRLFVGDAFRTPTGTWLPGLEEGQELVITFPDGYEVESVSRPLQNGTIHVEGPASFQPGSPSVVLQASEVPESPPWELIVGAAIGVAVVAILAYLFRGRLIGGFGPAGPTDASASPSAGGEPQTDGDGVEAEPAEAPDPMAEPLLSDEERVLRLLEAEDGRMKQVDIVEATDWSNAKVSQLLSEMEEAGKVDKLRIGRENLISLPGQGPGGE